MLSYQPLLLCCLLVVTQAKSFGARRLHSRTQGIQWSPCNLNGTLSILCGSLTVPLDYTDPTCTSTLDLEVLRIPTSNATSKGSILLNFGGPGDDGKSDFALFGAQLQRWVSSSLLVMKLTVSLALLVVNMILLFLSHGRDVHIERRAHCMC